MSKSQVFLADDKADKVRIGGCRGQSSFSVLSVSPDNISHKSENSLDISVTEFRQSSKGVATKDFRGSIELNGLQQLMLNKGDEITISPAPWPVQSSNFDSQEGSHSESK